MKNMEMAEDTGNENMPVVCEWYLGGTGRDLGR